MTTTEIIALISLTLISSLSHCISMCGGFVLSYSSVKIDKTKNMKYQSLMHILYGLGRTSSYIVLGALFGYLGKVIIVAPIYKGVLFILLGIIMIFIGISLVSKVNFVAVNLLNFSIFKQIHFKTFKSKAPSSFYVYGILNGLIPCGLVYFFLATAISSNSALIGAIYMGIFGLFTIPALFIFAMSNNFFSQKYQKLFNYISSFMIMSFGLITTIKGIYISFIFIKHTIS